MIRLKSAAEIAKMKKSCETIRDLLLFMEEKVRPGITTKKLDEFAYDYIKRKGATPSFLGYGGFPGSICASIDEVVVHGIPSSRRLEEGQIIGIDVGAILGGWQSDAARTFQGFTVIEGEYGITAEKGKFTFNFNKHSNSITIRVEVTNRFGIVF